MHSEEEHQLESREEGTTLCLQVRAMPCSGACRMLISLDYDGTLRPEEAPHVSPEFFELMHTMRPHGVRWGVNTGRSLRKLAGELAHFPALPDFICTCERYAYLADTRGILHPAEEHNARCHAANMALRESLLPRWQAELHNLRRHHPNNNWEIAADDPLSIEATDSAALDVLMPRLERFAGEAGVAIQRAGRFMRLSDARFTKGSALRYVQQAWQVQEQSLFIMGDGHNDIDAFRLFPKAFCAAPSTAHPEVICWLSKHGGYLSPEPGVLHALRHWCSLQGLQLPR